MDKALKKINKLLKFYYDEEVIIALKIKFGGGLVIRGKITSKNWVGMKYVIIKNKRITLSPKIRYGVLKRDRNTCKGCGARAPDVELEVDHIIPVSRGGSDELDNLRTLCRDCNIGKGNKV